MKRWHDIKHKFVEIDKADAFIKDILAVYDKHKLSISHEDGHGSFIIEDDGDDNRDWISNASWNPSTDR